MLVIWQSFGEDISILKDCRTMRESNGLIIKSFMDEMMIDFDVLGLFMKN